GQQIAAHFRPGQTSNLPDLVFFFGHAETETAHTQEVAEVFSRNRDTLYDLLRPGRFATAALACRRIDGQQFLDDLAADLADFTFQGTHTRFTCVVAHDIAYGRLFDGDFILLHAVVLHELGQQVIKGNMHFLVFGVTRKANDFHAVQQRGRNIQR